VTASAGTARPLGVAKATSVPVESSHNRAQLGIGRPAQLTLTHACPRGNPVADWHSFDLAFSNGEFRAGFTLAIPIRSLTSFRDQLISLNRDLRGHARLDAVEGELTLRGEVDKRGHTMWTGELAYPGGIWKARLEFEFEDDQTALPEIIKQLQALIAETQDESRCPSRS
jgi:hypothetical protein